MKKIILISILLTMALDTWAKNDCEEINWKDNRICIIAGGTANMDHAQSVGHARVIALKTARILAYEKLAEKLKGVIVGSQSTLTNGNLDETQVKTIVNATIRNVSFEKEAVSFLSDGSPWAEVTLSVPIYGKKGVASEVLRFENGGSSTTENSNNNKKTIVIDARHLSYKPGLFPKITSKSGTTLFSQDLFSKLGIGNNGLPLRTFTSLERASSVLEGKIINTIKALSIGKDGDLVLPNSSTKSFRDYLEEGNENRKINIIY